VLSYHVYQLLPRGPRLLLTSPQPAKGAPKAPLAFMHDMPQPPLLARCAARAWCRYEGNGGGGGCMCVLCRVGGVADAGLFLPAKDWSGGPGYVRLWRHAVELQRAALNPACVAAQSSLPRPTLPRTPHRPRTVKHYQWSNTTRECGQTVPAAKHSYPPCAAAVINTGPHLAVAAAWRRAHPRFPRERAPRLAPARAPIARGPPAAPLGPRWHRVTGPGRCARRAGCGVPVHGGVHRRQVPPTPTLVECLAALHGHGPQRTGTACPAPSGRRW
jgi:hypothetical protein